MAPTYSMLHDIAQRLTFIFLQDDGSHSVACEKCSVWQHSKCLGISQAEAEQEDFHFICADCQRRIEEAKRPKIPKLKFRIAASPPSSDANQRREQPLVKSDPEKDQKSVHHTSGMTANEQSQTPTPADRQNLPSGVSGIISQHRTTQNDKPSLQHTSHTSADTTARTAPSPFPHGVQSTPQHKVNRSAFQHQPLSTPMQQGSIHATSFNSQRPSSSGSIPSSFPSPIQNRPSMSPTQGNNDVGPLAGFPAPPAAVNPYPASNGNPPATPFGQRQGYHQHDNVVSPYPSPALNQPVSTSFSTAATAMSPQSSFGQIATPSRYPPNAPMSGLSPRKNSPTRPPSFTDVANTSVVPPVQKLHPSPKLIGQASPDAPIPPPVKNLAPEQGNVLGNRPALGAPAQSVNSSLNPHNQGPTAGTNSTTPPPLHSSSFGQGQFALNNHESPVKKS